MVRRRRFWWMLAVLVLLAGVISWVAFRPRPVAGPLTRADTVDRLARERARRAESLADARTARVSGRVTAKDSGAPILGAVVLLRNQRIDGGAGLVPGHAPAPLLAVSDSDGRFVLPSVPPGRYLASASAATFVPADKSDVGVAPGSERNDVDFALDPGGNLLSGVVSDIGGGPILGVLVSATNESEGSILRLVRPAYAALSDGEGRYHLQLGDGVYSVVAEHADYVAGHERITVRGAGQTLDFRLLPAASIRGRVLARTSEAPVAGALVTVQGGESGERGTWSMARLFPTPVVTDIYFSGIELQEFLVYF